ncbi:hypothetical protein IO355_000547 [Campylobacter upsaliensis]|nr:hypothetical protein [Campylobacter upsaliensis]EAI7237937.1 hypothetical protein [Campylobacter upsaliensis]EAI8674149.1 hypothetical protein [Campylobacter upsaliensis]EAJ0411990.1 hypothetical protein [Campylobacter upsaliensis]EAJ0879077.1 hypothetical protein [Campylobacter upsaliensis]
MKLSYHASKVLVGVSISALLSSVALVQDISINTGNAKNYFDTNDGQHFALKKEHANSDLNIKMDSMDLSNDIAKDGYEDRATVGIDLGAHNLSFENGNSGNKASYVTNYTITAKKQKLLM